MISEFGQRCFLLWDAGTDLPDLDSRNDINAQKPKQGGGGEEVFVVGVNLGETVLCCGSEVDGVGGAEIGGGWGARKGDLHAVEDGVAERKQQDGGLTDVRIELSEYGFQYRRRHQVLSDLSEADGIELGSAMLGANDLVSRACERLNLGRAMFDPVQLADVGSIEEKPFHRASRSAESPMLLSESKVSAPDLSSASYSGNSLRVAQKEGVGAVGVFSSTVSATSMR